MVELRTEEEQIEAIKSWWKKNGSSLLIGIALALAIVFGWQAWQNHQSEQRAQAANQFGALLNAYVDPADETSAETVEYLAKTLREDFDDTAYAIYGNLLLARQKMDAGDTSAAVDALQWAMERAKEYPALSLVVRYRLAKAQFADGQKDAALATLEAAGETGAFAALYSELKGDILLAKGDTDAARAAYLAARQQGSSALLELKLSDLGVGEDA